MKASAFSDAQKAFICVHVILQREGWRVNLKKVRRI
jgi:hypothetical protein